ncbi:antitoxin VbhA family protein [Corynebacterium macclintockiae]|uniref:antitoxin VbhA family protein n=1 Tax=Corynebacterium macclintockiae TaxID=2913501 RepID=UPI003EB6C5D7
MTTDNRTEDQKVAAVRASITMAGYTMTDQDEKDIRRIFRGELTGDEAVLQVLERDGYGDSERAEVLRQRIAKAKTRSSEGEKYQSTRQSLWYH